MTITGNFEQFQYFNFEINFLKNANFLKNFLRNKFSKKLEYRFFVESTKIDNITFPYKIALTEANVKTNRMGSTELTYHKEWSFANNHFLFSIILFQFRNLVYRVDVPTTQMSIFIVFESIGVLL